MKSPVASFEIVGGAGLERGYRDLAVLRGRDEHDRRRRRQFLDQVQHFEAVHARHVLIECDDIDTARFDAFDAGLAILAVFDKITLPLQPTLHQPRETRVVIDVE